MEKNTKILLGVALIGSAAYIYWKSMQPSKSSIFANASGKNKVAKASKKKKIVGDALKAGNGKFAKNLSGTVEAHSSTFNASGDDVLSSAEKNIVGGALDSHSSKW